MLNKAGATDRDLPWWFEIYHLAWFLFFALTFYVLGPLIALLIFIAIAAICVWIA
jgi:hypothetical protein